MNEQQSPVQIRKQELAQAIQDARTACRRDLEETAGAAGIPLSVYQAYEAGEQSPTLPVLELLAFFFNIPVEHFWNAGAQKKTMANVLQQKEAFFQLRNRVIAVQLRMARADQNLALPQVAAAAGIEEQRLRAQEAAQESLPLPELEQVCLALGMPVSELFDEHGPVGNWRAHSTAVENFMQLPSDLQEFLRQPANMPYINLAMRLSQLSVERLRSIAEGLLEITNQK